MYALKINNNDYYSISLVLNPTDFHHSPNRLSQRKTKLYCSEISKKLFPDYHDRRTTERTCSNVYVHSNFSTDIGLVTEKSGGWVTELGAEMEAQEQKGGEEVSRFDVGQKFAFDKVGRVCWENRCKTGKPWKESAFVAATGILYLLIRVAYPTYVSWCITLRAQCLSFMQIGPFEN
ncbi:hypothetical protein T01_8004 [Trichinella spiralis]|uniref:Uncharacterized protein n=1 Tax=Trichinella spiralis TaxID=6334 RepID=A0A0V1B3S7_TRISP|nr:hypothetical protein T01_8004 [Trichinella spiralis]